MKELIKTLRSNIAHLTNTTAGKMQIYLPNAQTRNVLMTPIKANILEAYGRLHMYLLANYQPDEYLAMGAMSPEEVSGLLSAKADPTFAPTSSSAFESRPFPSSSSVLAPVALDLSGGSGRDDYLKVPAAQAPAEGDAASLPTPQAAAAEEAAARQRAEQVAGTEAAKQATQKAAAAEAAKKNEREAAAATVAKRAAEEAEAVRQVQEEHDARRRAKEEEEAAKQAQGQSVLAAAKQAAEAEAARRAQEEEAAEKAAAAAAAQHGVGGGVGCGLGETVPRGRRKRLLPPLPRRRCGLLCVSLLAHKLNSCPKSEL